ncbi:hypothetical protein EJ03DRAFT_189499 [Teratosphaeria nubilosa]|uniref:Uncharacterized protein n=1 Tax=Teratosphaeria nubilosa TaxID=161662 RepID=A0A6G1LKF0_9PEZI|nr:hypothetical protein EJ03DRAFT_189499 [Teratosphaeria nubilosa]
MLPWQGRGSVEVARASLESMRVAGPARWWTVLTFRRQVHECIVLYILLPLAHTHNSFDRQAEPNNDQDFKFLLALACIDYLSHTNTS